MSENDVNRGSDLPEQTPQPQTAEWYKQWVSSHFGERVAEIKVREWEESQHDAEPADDTNR